MELAKLFLNSLNVKTDMQSINNQQPTGKNTSSFDSYLQSSKKEYNAKNDKSPMDTKRQKPNRNEVLAVKQGQLLKKSNKAIQDKAINNETTTDKPDTDNEITTNDKKPEEITKVSLDEKDIEQEIIKKLSEELDIPEEQIAQMLASLNITPLELYHSEDASNKLVQMIIQEEDPIQLHSMPEAKEIIEIIDNVLEEFKNLESELNLGNKIDIADNAIVNEEEAVPDVEKEPLIEITGNKESAFSQNNNSEGSNMQQNANSFSTNNQEVIQEIPNVVQTIIEDDYTIVEKTVKTTTKSAMQSDIDIMNQITEKIKIDYKPNITEMRITLRPNELGTLSLNISTENGVITASFLAENQRVKEIIESNFNTLKNILQEQGIKISEFTVNVGSESPQEKSFNQSRQKSRRRIEQILNNLNAEYIDDPDNLDNISDMGQMTGDGNYESPYEMNNNNIDFTA